MGLYGVTQGPLDHGGAVLAMLGRDDGLHRPVTAIGHRDLDDLGLGKDLAHPSRNGGGGLGRGQRSLESVGRDDDLHSPRLGEQGWPVGRIHSGRHQT